MWLKKFQQLALLVSKVYGRLPFFLLISFWIGLKTPQMYVVTAILRSLFFQNPAFCNLDIFSRNFAKSEMIGRILHLSILIPEVGMMVVNNPGKIRPYFLGGVVWGGYPLIPQFGFHISQLVLLGICEQFALMLHVYTVFLMCIRQFHHLFFWIDIFFSSWRLFLRIEQVAGNTQHPCRLTWNLKMSNPEEEIPNLEFPSLETGEPC